MTGTVCLLLIMPFLMLFVTVLNCTQFSGRVRHGDHHGILVPPERVPDCER